MTMARLPLVPLSGFSTPLANAVKRGVETRMLSSIVPIQVWAHRPQTALAWLALLDRLHNHSLLSARLRELVRLRIARITQCQACVVARKSDQVQAEEVASLNCALLDNKKFSPAERAALTYAELFAEDPIAVEGRHFSALAEHFSTAAIVELQMFCALMLAGGRMTLVQQAYEETPR